VKIFALFAAAVFLGSCAGSSGGEEELTLAAVLDDPDGYDGERVTFEAGYYGAFEVSVLTPGFAESFPPQPMEPQIWVNAGPSEECLQREERSAWAERVRASGVFRYSAERGFGHLGAYEMALEDATLTCL
jgi:hypothetical protein